MGEIKILKAKLIKGGESLKTTEARSNNVQCRGEEEYHNAVHPDLIKSFEGLRPHLGVLSGILQEKDAKDKDLIEKFQVTGYSRGKDESGVVITGRYNGPYGGVTINTPFLSLDGEGEQPYTLLGDLTKKLQKCETEVIEYIGGKTAQGTLDFNTDEPVTVAKIDHPLNKKEKALMADPDAMQRVKEWTPGEYKDEQEKSDKKNPNKGKNGKKKVAQSATAPSGEIEE